jgi:hypothetical protein
MNSSARTLTESTTYPPVLRYRHGLGGPQWDCIAIDVIYAQNPTYLVNGAMQEFTSHDFSNKFHMDYNKRLQHSRAFRAPVWLI